MPKVLVDYTCIPSDLLSPDQHTRIRRIAHDGGCMRALIKRVVDTEADLTIRDALPRDLGLQTLEWRTPPLLKGEFTSFIDYPVPTDEVLVMYGIAQEDKNPAACVIRVCEGTDFEHEYNMIPLQRLYARIVAKKGICQREGMLVQPIWFDPAQRMQILVGSRENKPEGDRLIPLLLRFKPKEMLNSLGGLWGTK